METLVTLNPMTAMVDAQNWETDQSSFSSEMEVAKLSAAPSLEVVVINQL